MKLQSLLNRSNRLKSKLGRELSTTIEILRFHVTQKKALANKLKETAAATGGGRLLSDIDPFTPISSYHEMMNNFSARGIKL